MNHPEGNNQADRQLVTNAIAGDRRAFALIISQTEKLVASIVCSMITNTEDRKDIVQDIYLKTFHNLRKFRFESRLSTWIGQISYNTCRDYLRKRKPFVEIDTDDEYSSDRVFAGDDDTGAAVMLKESGSVLNHTISLLTPLYRAVIVLYHQEEQTYEEIAGMIGVPVGTVKSKLFRARRQLRTLLLKEYKKEDL